MDKMKHIKVYIFIIIILISEYLLGFMVGMPKHITIETGENLKELMLLTNNVSKNMKQINYSCDIEIPPYVCPDCICNVGEKKTNEIKKPIIENCEQKLNLCNIRLDSTNKEIYAYMISNNTDYAENMTIQLKQVNESLRACEDKLKSIGGLI